MNAQTRRQKQKYQQLYKIKIKCDKPKITQWKRDLGSSVYSVVWSPRDDMIVAGVGNKIFVFDTESGNIVWQRHLGNTIRSVTFSPDGTRIAAGGDFREVIIFNAKTGSIKWRSGNLGGSVYSVAWSPTGDKIA